MEVSRGRLLSDEIGPELYNALRARILRARHESMNKQENEKTRQEEEDDETNSGFSSPSPSSSKEIAEQRKELFISYDFLKRVKRGMLLHLADLKEVEIAEAKSNVTMRDEITDVGHDITPLKRRRRLKTISLSAKKGSRRAGRSARRGTSRLKKGLSLTHELAERLLRRSSPAAKYSLRGQKFSTPEAVGPSQ